MRIKKIPGGLIFTIALIALLVSLNSCGKRGFPKPSGDKEVYYPKNYPTH